MRFSHPHANVAEVRVINTTAAVRRNLMPISIAALPTVGKRGGVMRMLLALDCWPLSDLTAAGPEPSDYALPEPRARAPIVELLTLALPTVAQMASYTVMNFTDTWMLSKLGLVEPTASANASLFGFALVSVGFGTMWVVNTLVSQAFGRGDRESAGRYLWAGVWFGVIFGLIILPLIPLGRPLFNLFGHEPRLAALEAQYLTITLSVTAVRLAGAAAGQFLLAIDRPMLTLLAAVGGVIANIGANYLLIWGHFGFPKLGLAGAAWGTNVAALVEVILLAAFVLLPSIRTRYAVLQWRPGWARFKTLLRVGLPAGFQMVGDVMAWAVFGMWVMAFYGTEAMAANTFMMRYMSMSFLPAFGLSAGVTALVGRYIGRGQPDVAAARAALGYKLATAYMLGCGLLFAVFGRSLVGLFTADADVLRMGAILMIFAAVYQLFDALYIIYSGALRGAGDTFVPALVTAGLVWSMVIGLGGAVAYTRPEWGVSGPWAVASVYGVVLGLFMWRRFRRGAWRDIRLDGPDEGRGF